MGTGVTAWLGVGHTPLIAVAFGLLTLIGGYLHYGFDLSLTARREDGFARDATDQALAALARAENSIAAIEQASRDIHHPDFNARLRRIVQLARDILTLLEEDPRDLRRARKFLSVYLEGIQGIVEGYARTHTRVAAPDLDKAFRRVLTTIEEVFQEQQRTLLHTDLTDLDVQIDVLLNQLKREGMLTKEMDE